VVRCVNDSEGHRYQYGAGRARVDWKGLRLDSPPSMVNTSARTSSPLLWAEPKAEVSEGGTLIPEGADMAEERGRRSPKQV
jgi:hypothetical protein